MLTLKLLREQPEFVIERLAVKNFDAAEIVAKILDADAQRRAAQTQLDSVLAEQNAKAKEIGMLMKQGKKEEAEEAKKLVASLKEQSKELEVKMEEHNKVMTDYLVMLPNIPCAEVPAGKTAEDNVVVKEGGCKTELPANAKFCFECGNKIGGIPMADNKQYVTQMQDNGAVLISEDVIITIVTHAIEEVEGVVGLNAKPGADIVEMIGKKNWGKGLKITIDEEDSITVDCNITVAYGQSVVSVAAAVQSSVTNALESMAGVKIAAVNVNVCGIVRQ